MSGRAGERLLMGLALAAFVCGLLACWLELLIAPFTLAATVPLAAVPLAGTGDPWLLVTLAVAVPAAATAVSVLRDPAATSVFQERILGALALGAAGVIPAVTGIVFKAPYWPLFALPLLVPAPSLRHAGGDLRTVTSFAARHA